MTFYDWLIKLTKSEEHKAHFSQAMDGLDTKQQSNIFRWLKFAYVEGYFYGSNGVVLKDDEEELPHTEESVVNSEDNSHNSDPTTHLHPNEALRNSARVKKL